MLKSSSNKLPVTRVRDAERLKERASGGCGACAHALSSLRLRRIHARKFLLHYLGVLIWRAAILIGLSHLYALQLSSYSQIEAVASSSGTNPDFNHGA